MTRYALKLCYFGYNYHGFEAQENAISIKAIIHKAFLKYGLDPNKLNMQGASRTDKGVHALSQVIGISTEQPIYLGKLNKYLPEDMWFWGIAKVHDSFNPRKEALFREYLYICPYNGVDLQLIGHALKCFIGIHNFFFFAKRDKNREINYFRTIDKAEVEITNNFLYFKIRAQSFLWQQVRRMIRAVLLIGEEKMPLQALKQLLKGEKNAFATRLSPMPPEGLILANIKYPFAFKYSDYVVMRMNKKFTDLIEKLMLKKEVIQAMQEVMKNAF